MTKLSEVEVPLITSLDLRPATVLADERVMRQIDRMWNWPEPPKIGIRIERMAAKMVDRAVTFKIVLDTSEFERSMRRMQRITHRAAREQRALRRQARIQRVRWSWHWLRNQWNHNHDEIVMYVVVGVIAVLATFALVYLINGAGR